MSEKDIVNDIKHLDRACDALAQACFEVSQANDWIGAAALVTMEQILDDLAERVTELRHIKRKVEEISDGNLG